MYKREKEVGRMSRILRFFVCLGTLFFAGNALAAGYSCSSLPTYLSCQHGYYMTANKSSTTHNGTPKVGNYCQPCSKMGSNYTCAGGTAAPVQSAGGYTCPTYKRYTSCSAGYYMTNSSTSKVPDGSSKPGNACRPCSVYGSNYTCDGGTAAPRAITVNVTCQAGQYLPKGATSCTTCPAGSYCPSQTCSGVSLVTGATSACGITSCRTATSYYFESAAGSSNINDCYRTLSVAEKVETVNNGLDYCTSGEYCDNDGRKVYYDEYNEERDLTDSRPTIARGTACARGSYSDDEATACEPCPKGKTTSGTGSGSCGVTCSNSANVETWVEPTWTPNYVSNSCKIASCVACTKGTGVASCTASTDGNKCTYTATCASGYKNPTCNGSSCSCEVGSYTITLNATANGGTGGMSAVYEVPSVGWYSNAALTTSISSVTMPTKANSVFNGYYSAQSGGTRYITNAGALPSNTTFSANTTLYAQYSTASCNVTNGSATMSISGNKVSCAVTCNTGYSQSGGTNATTSFTVTGAVGTASVSASCSPRTFTVSLMNNGGTGGTSTIYLKYATGWYSDAAATKAITSITMPTKTNSVFNGYYSAQSGGTRYITNDGALPSSNTTFTANTTLYAQYSAAGCNVTHGSATMLISGNAVSCYVTCDTGYSMNGGTDTTTIFTEGGSVGQAWVTSKCFARTSTVSFNANGGTGGQSANATAKYDSAMPSISTTAPTRTGYTFMGWYDNADYTKGTQYYTTAGASARTWNKVADATLYAGWKVNSYTCTAGQYLKAGATACATCTANSWCGGGTFSFNSGTDQGLNACPSDYSYSDAGTSSEDNCYKNAINTGSQIAPALPTGCAAQTVIACHPDRCWYRIYKSGTTTSCTPKDCQQSHKACTSASKNYYLESGVAKSCSSADVLYPSSDGGDITSSSCYGTFDKTGSQVNGSVPTNCNSVTSWNACTPGTCQYTKYASGTVKTDCTPTNCTKKPAAVTAKSGYYVSGTSCTACNGLAGGMYPNSDNDNTGGASACRTDSLSGQVIATANASSATQCVPGTFKAAHTVNYGGTSSSCEVCSNNQYSDAGAASCTGCKTANGYTNSGTTAASHAGEASCKATCAAGTYVATAGSACTTVGTGYWGAGGTVSQNTTLGRNQCPEKYRDGAAATQKSDCAVQTTAGKYIAAPEATEQTKCPAKNYCPSASVKYGETNSPTACPPADATTARTTYPDDYLNPTRLSISNQGWSTGLPAITSCSANYTFTNAAGNFTVESVEFNETSGKYEVGGGKYYTFVNAGWYLVDKYSETYCNEPTNRMLYHNVAECPANSYCPGYTSMPLCSTGTHNDEMGKYACSDLGNGYNYSPAKSGAATACYLTTTAGKYVATSKAAESTCAAGGWCAGGTKVNYESTGGRTLCSSLSGVSVSGGTYTSAAGSSANTACKYTAPNKTITGCATVTTNTVTYSGTAWPTTTYGVTANGGYIISGNNTAAATCSQCSGAVWSAGGTATSCSACPAQTSGWTRNSGTGWSAVTQCNQTQNVGGNCRAGVLKQNATSTTAWGATTISTPLQANPGSIVNGQKCDQCSGAVWSAGGTATSCSACPAQTSGWTRNSGTGWSAVTQCNQTQNVGGNCRAGVLKQNATSTTAWGATTISTPLQANPGSIVNGQKCDQCSGAVWSAGGTATSCSACPAQTSGWTRNSGTGWSAVTQCNQTQNVGGNCRAGVLKQNATSTTAWGASTISTPLQAKPGSIVNGQKCDACNPGTYSAGGTATSCNACANWTYAASTGMSSCTACPALTSGWAKADSTGTGWKSHTSCVQISPKPANCAGGNLKQVAASNGATTWGASTVNSALSSNPGYYINGTACSACTGAEYYGGGTATSCTPCPSIYTSNTTAAKSKAEQCTVQTTGGYYIKAAKDSKQTECDGGYYCPSATVAYGSTNTRTACPVPADHKRATIPAEYYTNSIANTYIAMSGRKSAITECQVLNTYNGTRGSLYDYVTYNTTTRKYDVQGSVLWFKANPGYYLTTATGCGTYAYYGVAKECDKNAYCPGKDQVECNSSNQATVQVEKFGLELCSALGNGKYATSDGGAAAKSTAACYLTTSNSKFVAAAGAAEGTCTAGGWCPGGVRVNYGSTGGRNTCPTKYPSSAASSNSELDCYVTTAAGKYVATVGAGQVNCAGTGYYCPGGTNVYSGAYGSRLTTGGRNQCPAGYRDLVATASTTKEAQCTMNVAGGKYVAKANESAASGTCAAGYAKAAHSVTYGNTSSCAACTGTTYAENTGQASCTACPTQSGVTNISYWISTGTHTDANGCYGFYNNVALDNGSAARIQCFWDKTKSQYDTSCGAMKDGLKCNAAYYNAALESSPTNNAAYYTDKASVIAKACTSVGKGHWSPADVYTRTQCPAGYRDGTAGVSESQCTMNVAGGKYVAKANESAASGTCDVGYAKAAHSVTYGNTSSCTACTGATYAASTGQATCTTCPTAKTYASAVKSYGYWNNGKDGDHTISDGCYATMTGTLSNGSLTEHGCYLGTDGDYGNGGGKRCYVHQDNLKCNAGYYASTLSNGYVWNNTRAGLLGNTCVGVGAGYYSAANILTRNQCPTGLTTIGYGAGADEVTDCGRILHFGNDKLYLRSGKKTTPSLNVKIGDTTYYGNMTAGTGKGKLRLKSGTTTYSVHDDSM